MPCLLATLREPPPARIASAPSQAPPMSTGCLPAWRSTISTERACRPEKLNVFGAGRPGRGVDVERLPRHPPASVEMAFAALAARRRHLFVGNRLRQLFQRPVGRLEIAVGDVVAVMAERTGAVRPVHGADLVVGEQRQKPLFVVAGAGIAEKLRGRDPAAPMSSADSEGRAQSLSPGRNRRLAAERTGAAGKGGQRQPEQGQSRTRAGSSGRPVHRLQLGRDRAAA